MKTLANCTPTEFLKQSLVLRKPLEKWFDEVGAAEIRKRKPEGFDEMTDEEKTAAITEQGKANLGDILLSAMEKDMDGTLEVMALLCFTDPKDVDTHTMTEYLEAIAELITNPGVRGFFTLLLKAGQQGISEG